MDKTIMENKNAFFNTKAIKIYKFLALFGMVVAASIMFVVNRKLDFIVIFQFLLYFVMYMSLINDKRGKNTSQDAIWMIVTFIYSIIMSIYFGINLHL